MVSVITGTAVRHGRNAQLVHDRLDAHLFTPRDSTRRGIDNEKRNGPTSGCIVCIAGNHLASSTTDS